MKQLFKLSFLLASVILCLFIVSCKKESKPKVRNWHNISYEYMDVFDSFGNTVRTVNDTTIGADESFAVTGLGSSNVTFKSITLTLTQKTDTLSVYSDMGTPQVSKTGLQYYPLHDSMVILFVSDKYTHMNTHQINEDISYTY